MRVHSIVCCVAIALALSSAAAAGDISVPDNNPAAGTACNVGPFGYAEARHQTLVPASMLGGKSFLINELCFAPCTNPAPTQVFSTLVVTFAHTTQGSLSTLLATNLAVDATIVLNGPVTWTPTYQQWSPMGLTGTFRYNGVDNLVVEVKFIGKTGSSLGCYRCGNIERAYKTGAGSFNIPTATTSMSALKMQFRFPDISLTITGSPRPGGKLTLDLLSGGDAGLPYQLGSSFGLGPIVLGPRQIDLSPDVLLALSVGNSLPSVFVNYSGVLDTSGTAKAGISLPAVPALVGISIYTAFVTLDPASPFGIRSISGAEKLAIIS
ncbi:MAG: hypothetical protein JXQ29_09445 [Planctomycetes bacterium]|nr:hypothetical protein [Planctomycetota bacterium]